MFPTAAYQEVPFVHLMFIYSTVVGLWRLEEDAGVPGVANYGCVSDVGPERTEQSVWPLTVDLTLEHCWFSPCTLLRQAGPRLCAHARLAGSSASG